MSADPSRYFRVLGLPNFLSSSGGVTSASSEASASLAATNLKTEEPSEFWRSASGDSLIQYIQGRLAFINVAPGDAADMLWDGVGIVRHNLRKGSGQYRVLGVEQASLSVPTPWTNIYPNADAGAGTNVTGTFADVDEAGAEGGTYIEPAVTTTAWAKALEFPTPGATPRWLTLEEVLEGRKGAYQIIGVWVVASSAPASISLAPVIELTVIQDGNQIANTVKRITSATGQWVYIEIPEPATPAHTNGADMTLLMEGSPSITTLISCKVGRVRWHCESTEITGSSNIDHDSEWIKVYPEVINPLAGGLTADSPNNRLLDPQSIFYYSGELTRSQMVRVYFRDDWCPFGEFGTEGYTAQFLNPTYPVGYIEAGCLMVGQTWSPEHPPSVESNLIGVSDSSSQQRTRGGQEFGVVGPRLRTATITMPWLSIHEAAFVFERWIRSRGLLGPVLITTNPASAYEVEPTTLYCTLESAETPMGANLAQGDGNRALTLTVKEKR